MEKVKEKKLVESPKGEHNLKYPCLINFFIVFFWEPKGKKELTRPAQLIMNNPVVALAGCRCQCGQYRCYFHILIVRKIYLPVKKPLMGERADPSVL